MQLVTFSLCVASAVALPTAPPTSVPKTVTAPRIPSASFLTALATQPALGNETMSVLMATMMANHEARPAGRHLQTDPKSDAELMKSAVEAAKLTIGTIKDAVTGFLNQVAEVDKEIKALNPTGIDQQMMVNFTTSAATASIPPLSGQHRRTQHLQKHARSHWRHHPDAPDGHEGRSE